MTDSPTESSLPKPWQAKISRRRFIGTGAALAGAAALAGYLPESLISRVTAASAATTGSSFDLSQVKHLVFLMQENRSFDHYFGTFPGVSGFSDPTAVKLPNGRSVFQQPDPANPDGYLEPLPHQHRHQRCGCSPFAQPQLGAPARLLESRSDGRLVAGAYRIRLPGARALHHGLLRPSRTSPSTGPSPRRLPSSTTITVRCSGRRTRTGPSG